MIHVASVDLAAVIDMLRQEHRLSERQLAQLSGMNRTTLRSALRRKISFRVDDAERILKLFGFKLAIVQYEPLSEARSRLAEVEA